MYYSHVDVPPLLPPRMDDYITTRWKQRRMWAMYFEDWLSEFWLGRKLVYSPPGYWWRRFFRYGGGCRFFRRHLHCEKPFCRYSTKAETAERKQRFDDMLNAPHGEPTYHTWGNKTYVSTQPGVWRVYKGDDLV